MFSEELAINGGTPTKQTPFPDWPMYDERELAAVTAVIQSGQWWRGNGTQTALFEQEFASYHGALGAFAVTNGTQAIELALAALDIGRNDEVIVPAFTFISTATAVLNAHAVPVLVDVDPNTYCLDPVAVAAAITPRTRAIIPVHMAGHVANMAEIGAIASSHYLTVIEDAAHAQGAAWDGRPAGALQDVGIFSFQQFKLMSAGEGGIIVSNDAAFIDRCFLHGNCGRPKNDRTYQHSLLGSNCRMSELQAAVLRVQLTRLAMQIERREANAALLDQLLQDVPGISVQGRDPHVTRHSHYMYLFRYDPAAFGDLPRQEFVNLLIAEGVPAFVAYLAIHQTPLFRNRTFGARWRDDLDRLPDYTSVHCPVAEDLSAHGVWLHHRVLLGTTQDIVELVDAIRKIQTHMWHSTSVS
jgi:3-amino-5-hydroxybenzoate synthase